MVLKLPTRMPAAEIEKYRAQGYDILPGRETPTYRPEWGLWEAVRDIAQNSLDETETVRIDNVENTFVISDAGGGFNVPALLLGQPKPKPPHMRGRFGEGLKIAVLALLRLDYPVSFETVGLEGAATFMRQSLVGVEAEVLTFVVRRNARKRGTIWTLWKRPPKDYKTNFAQFLPRPDAAAPSLFMREPIPRTDFIWLPNRGQNPYPMPGDVYARDIYMATLASSFAYNLWSFELAPDRHAPKSDDELRMAIGMAWTGVGRVDMLTRLLQDLKAGINIEDNIRWSALPDVAEQRARENASAWRQAATAVWGSGIVILTEAGNAAGVKYLGGNPINVDYYLREWLAMFFPTDKTFIEQKGADLVNSIKIVSDYSLRPEAFQVLQLVRVIAKLLPLREDSKRRPLISATTIGEKDVRGYWDENSFTIGIQHDALDDPVEALDIFIHEYAHYLTQASDVTARHAKGISLVGAYIAELFALGQVPAGNAMILAASRGLA